MNLMNNYIPSTENVILGYNIRRPSVYKARLERVGGSIMLAVPPAMLKALELSTDSEVGMIIDNDHLIIGLQKRPHYSLEELSARCDPYAEMSEEDREWIDAPMMGKEVLQMDRGEIWLVSLDPITGHEQSGKRPVLITLKASPNKLVWLPVMALMTSSRSLAHTTGFTVSLEEAGTKTTGVIRCDQPRTIDMVARGSKRLERIPDIAVNEVLARLDAILS